MSATKAVRWLLQRYWRISRGLTLAVVGLVVDEGGRVLLVRDDPEGQWRLPGGLAFNDERAIEALRRHLASDCGLAAAEPPRLLALDPGVSRATGDHIAVYLVPRWQRLARDRSRVGAGDTAFADPNGLPDGLAAGTRERLAHLPKEGTARRPVDH